MQARVFCFSLVAAAFWISTGTCSSGRKKQWCAKYTKSHFRQDFLANYTRPVSVHVAVVCVGCLFNNFSVFLLCFTQHKTSWNLCFPVSIFQYGHIPPKIMKKNVEGIMNLIIRDIRDRLMLTFPVSKKKNTEQLTEMEKRTHQAPTEYSVIARHSKSQWLYHWWCKWNLAEPLMKAQLGKKSGAFTGNLRPYLTIFLDISYKWK